VAASSSIIKVDREIHLILNKYVTIAGSHVAAYSGQQNVYCSLPPAFTTVTTISGPLPTNSEPVTTTSEPVTTASEPVTTTSEVVTTDSELFTPEFTSDDTVSTDWLSTELEPAATPQLGEL